MTYAIETLARERPLWCSVDEWSRSVTTPDRAIGSPPIGLPIGTVTFLLTDIESSTIAWERDGDAMAEAVTRHYELLDEAISAFGGVRPEEQGEGDSVVAAFSRASDAVGAALRAQLALQSEAWPTSRPVKVRMAVHTGEARLRGESNYVGLAIVRTARLRGLAHGGQVLISSASRDLALDQLGDEIDLVDLGDHRLKDLARPERVYQLVHERLASTFPPLRSLDSFAHNLPVRLSTFIGRHDELTTLDELLASHRLVTITGAGGAGKTRLALQAAANRVDRAPDGTWWVELAPLTDPEQVSITLANVLNLTLTESSEHAEAIAAHFATGHALIVFDNCEHLGVAPAMLVQSLLERCPNLQVLATSRSPLDVPGELTWRVPPLSSPSKDSPGTTTPVPVETYTQFDAVQLFVDRAHHARPTFSLDDENGPTVAEICSRLDGIPLAIELAAARTKSMRPEMILRGLDDALRLLSGGSRLVLPRQQTLEASIRWSCELLDDQARTLLARLSVFSGTFDLVAAEAACADDAIMDGSSDESKLGVTAILDALERLVDRSLVVSLEGVQAGRFLMLETVRQFGHRQLTEAGTLQRWRRSHAEYFERLVGDVAPGCETADQFASLGILRADIDNVRAALSCVRELGEVDRLAAMVSALGPYWDVGGDKLEGVNWCTRALQVLPDAPSVRRARLLALRGECRLTMGEWAGCLGDAQAAVEMGEHVADHKAWGRGSSTLTTIHALASTLDVWRASWTETIRLLREADDAYGLAGNLQWGAVPLLRRGYITEGLSALAASEPETRRCGSPELLACQMLWESFGRIQTGEAALAERLASAALDSGALGAPARIDGARLMVALARNQLGVDRASLQDHLDAAEHAEAMGEHVLSANRFLMAGIEAQRRSPEIARDVIDRFIASQPHMLPLDQCEAAAVSIVAALQLRDLDDVVRRTERVRQLAERCESPLYLGRSHTWIAAVHVDRNEMTDASREIHAAISLLWSCGARYFLVDAIEVLATLAARCNDTRGAVQLLGAIARMRREMQSPRSETFNRQLAETAATAQASLGDANYDVAFAAGGTLSDDEVIALVERTRGTRGRPAIGWESLTPTELQVSELVRDGLTNRQIAERLLMGAETVKTHMLHIFAKLGLSKRSQLSALVAERHRGEQ